MLHQHKRYARLSQDERYRIEVLLLEHYPLRKIASVINRNVSIVSREIQRNKRRDGTYTARYALKQAHTRRMCAKRAFRKIEADPELALYIEQKLRGDHVKGDWSPEVIAHTLPSGAISHKCIYAWIKRSRPDLVRVLPNQGRRRARYGSVGTRKYREQSLPLIDLRPESAKDRIEIGHLEGDTVVLNGGRIHTLVERTSRFLIAESIRQQGPGLALQLSESAVNSLSAFPVSHRKSITYDQGSEFAWWDETERRLQGTRIYFAHVHRPWERGTNERINGLLRRYFPKGTKFDTLIGSELASAVWRMNHRPRKILHWRTSCQVFGRCCCSEGN